jgi:hypothetical protein
MELDTKGNKVGGKPITGITSDAAGCGPGPTKSISDPGGGVREGETGGTLSQRSLGGEVPKGLKGMTHAEKVARAEQETARRLEALKARNLPERTYKVVDSIPSMYRVRHIKALVKECSANEAIVAKCLDCVGWEAAKEEIGQCAAYSCPLWQWRPYQASGSEIQ